MAAGALHSAQLLHLSGIGPEALLKSFDIPLAVDLPGVGNNLQDHCLVGTFYPCRYFSLDDIICGSYKQTTTAAILPQPNSLQMLHTKRKPSKSIIWIKLVCGDILLT